MNRTQKLEAIAKMRVAMSASSTGGVKTLRFSQPKNICPTALLKLSGDICQDESMQSMLSIIEYKLPPKKSASSFRTAFGITRHFTVNETFSSYTDFDCFEIARISF